MTGPRLHLLAPGPLDQRTGGYIYDARMAAGLRRRGWQVDVHALTGAFPEADAAARASVAATLAGLAPGSRVLIDGLAMGGLPAPVEAERDRLRILALVHHPLADETGLSAAAQARLAASERRSLAAAHGVIVTSAVTARRLDRFGVDPARIRVARPGTDRAPRAIGPPPGAPPQLLSVGSVVPRKGYDVLVRALARIRQLPWRCVCVGSLARAPDHARRVRARAAAAGLDGRMRFAGECRPAACARAYAGSSAFVLASYDEGYGMALTEALARGLPVVSTTGGAIPATVPRAAGLLVPPGDDGALALALGAILDPAVEGPGGVAGPGAVRRRRLAQAARRYAATLPDWEAAAGTLADALLALAPAAETETGSAAAAPAVRRGHAGSPTGRTAGAAPADAGAGADRNGPVPDAGAPGGRPSGAAGSA